MVHEQSSRGRAQPRRRTWAEALIVVSGLLEVVLTVVTASAWWELLPPILILPLVGGLLLRHRTWHILLPLLLLLNAAGWSITVLVVATFAYASRSPDRIRTLAVALLAMATAFVPAYVVVRGQGLVITTGVLALIVFSTAVLGMYVGTRRQLLQELHDRTEAAETGRAVAEDQARRAERTRIAREMHDIVAHKISLVALQAGALEVNQNLEREAVQNGAALIRSTATEALNELRQVLGVLRGSDDGPPLAPQPTWNDVRALVDRSHDAGVAVDLYDFIDSPVPDALARTAYRVVQEALTNIHKHARHTRARVALIGEPGSDLVVEISNVLPRGFTSDLPGARMGLSGIEARVTHAGGTITSGPTDDGHFEVKAVIPWPKPETPSE